MEMEVIETPEQIEEMESAMSAAFNKAGVTEKPQSIEKPSSEVESQPIAVEPKADEPIATPEPDPWAGVPQVVRDKLEAAIGEQQKFTQRMSSYEGRVGKLNDLYRDAASAAEAARNNPTIANTQKAENSLENWKRESEDLPEIFGAVDERIAERLATEREQILQSIKQQGSNDDIKLMIADAKTEARQLARVDIAHPDWETVINSSKFGAWTVTQTPEIQALAASEHAGDAIQMISLYKQYEEKVIETAKQSKENENRLERAITPKGVPQPGGKTAMSEEDAMNRAFHKK